MARRKPPVGHAATRDPSRASMAAVGAERVSWARLSIVAPLPGLNCGQPRASAPLTPRRAFLPYCRQYARNFDSECHGTAWAKLTRPCDAALRSAPFGQAAAWVSRFALRIACENDLLRGLRNDPIQVLQPIPVLSFHCRPRVTALCMITERSVFGRPNPVQPARGARRWNRVSRGYEGQRTPRGLQEAVGLHSRMRQGIRGRRQELASRPH